jgi:hypothetical protein
LAGVAFFTAFLVAAFFGDFLAGMGKFSRG